MCAHSPAESKYIWVEESEESGVVRASTSLSV